MPKRKREEKKSKSSKRRKVSVADELLSGYSNESNPFGDSNLTSQFVWKKKIQQDKDDGKVTSSKKKNKKKEEKKRLKSVKREIEKTKQRREEREREKRQWEEEISLIERERNKQDSEDWETREITFHLKQAKDRSEIRIKEGRAKSIDWIYQWVMLGYSSDKDKEHERQKLYPIYNPCYLIEDLTLEQLQELVDDIQIILSTQNNFTGAYETLLILCNYEIDKRNGIQDAMKTLEDLKVTELFIGKSSKELEELQEEVQNMLNAGGPIDVVYWENILKISHLFKARATLSEMHKNILDKRFKLVGTEIPHDAIPPKSSISSNDDNSGQVNFQGSQSSNEISVEKYLSHNLEVLDSNDNLQHSDDQTIDFERDYKTLAKQRLKALEEDAKKFENAKKDKDEISTEDLLVKRERERGLEENEEEFTMEVDLVQKKHDEEYNQYPKNDLYRPRKPKYYNRIKTGFEWNKYNQTHYDQDNPPPKIIQGYKFNIFYPDLIDPSKSPTFVVEKSEEDTTIIRFHAGPPYEDIAFRIVNKEWESSHRKGYRCVFDRGVLQLWFNFKRYRYRR